MESVMNCAVFFSDGSKSVLKANEIQHDGNIITVLLDGKIIALLAMDFVNAIYLSQAKEK